MDIKQISYFMAVAQEGSYSRAAEKLAVSQPTLSMAVKKLEEELGAELFYSFNRRQTLTDRGQRLKEGATRLLEVYQETVENVTRADDSSGTVTLGLSPMFGACFFGELLPGFSELYPNINIRMIEADGASKINDLIEKGEVDLAVTLNTEQAATFASCHFSTQRNVVLVHKRHPLADARSLSVADLRNESFAIFSQDFILHRQIVSACHAAGFRPKFALLSTQWDFMVALVAQNRAVSILPKPVMDRHPDPNVRCVPLTGSVKYWDMVLAWNRQKYMTKACKLFLDYLREHLPPDDL